MNRNTIWVILALLFLYFASSSVISWRASRYVEPAKISPTTATTSTAYFAGGCFWCSESDFEALPGVIEVISGYSGGHLPNPTYPEVGTHTTGHREAIEVRYDAAKITYSELVAYFFSTIDPEDAGGQFVDRGESYTAAAFPKTAEEDIAVRKEIERLLLSGVFTKPIVTAIIPFEKFWPAEEYHQNYYKKNPLRYEYYRLQSGRDQRVKEICTAREEKGIPCTSIPLH